MFKRWSIIIISVLIILTAFTVISAKQNIELNVSAAISLKDVLIEIQKSYEAKNTDVKINLSFGSSGALQKQIEQGAPADLFLSAAAKQMDALEKKGLIMKNTRCDLLKNQLVLIIPSDSKLQIKDFEDLESPSVKNFGMGAPESVPAGQYALQTLQSLGIWEKIKEKAVLGTNVRAVLAYVETGNVDAGIVYRTDAAVCEKVKIVATAPKGTHESIIYPAAITTNVKEVKEAGKFLDYLSTSEAKSIFERFGFISEM